MNKYKKVCINGKYYREHRLIWEQHYGKIPAGMDIDHINQDKSDNRIENLRLATRSQNKANSKKHSDNKSGYKGVTYYKKYNKWMAQISHHYKKKTIGYFDTPEEAYEAYKKTAEEIFGKYASY